MVAKDPNIKGTGRFPLLSVRRWVAILLVAALAVWAAIAWIHLAATVIRYYSPLPFWDYWETVPQFDSLLHGHLAAAFWDQHNEHRMVFPSVVFAADYLLFAGREILPLSLNVAFYFATWLVLSVSLWRSDSPLLARLCCGLLGGVVMAWDGAALEMSGAFLVQWSLLLVSAALAFFLLAEVPRRARPLICLSTSIACAVIATYSAASGLLMWPMMVVVARFLRLSRAQTAAIIISAVVFCGTYFAGYRFSGETNLGVILRHPLYSICFVAAYMGSPFTLVKPWLGITLGLVLASTLLTSMVLAARRTRLNQGAAVVLFGMYGLCFLTALMTAIGRMNPNDPRFGAATAQRYIAVPLVGDACVLLAAALLLMRTPRLYLGTFLSCAFVMGLSSAGRSQAVQEWSNVARTVLRNTQLVSLAVKSGIDDPVFLTSVYPDLVLVRQRINFLRSHHLSIFSDRQADWLGRPALSVVRYVSDTPEPGAVTHISPIERGLIVTGWTETPRSTFSPEVLVLLDDERKVVGFGGKIRGGIVHELEYLDTPNSLSWIGFVNLQISAKPFAAYSLESGGNVLVRVGGVQAVPPFRHATSNEVGLAFHGISWQIHGAWSQKGAFPVAPRNFPEGENYFESWNGNDANVGTLRSDKFVAPNGCIVLGAANGPSTAGLSETVLDADTGTPVASIPLIGSDTSWHYWKVTPPQTVHSVEILAVDNGRGWGQWLAISEPRSCN